MFALLGIQVIGSSFESQHTEEQPGQQEQATEKSKD
jgi:hypothetical protein